MYEKLKQYQPLVAQELESSIRNGKLSRSSLFCGEKYSLRMTAAIETAKALSCFKDGEDYCDCASCKQFKTMSVQNTVIVSNRNFDTRITAAIERFCNLRTDFSKKFLIETVRILLLSYHSSLYNDKNKALFTAAYEVSDLLIEFTYHKEEYGSREAKSFTKRLKTSLKPLLDQDKKNLTNLSVDSVRNLQKWISQTKVKDKARIIIIEGIEKSNDSVRNSLLKILEEPSEGIYFILLSENPGRIMKTILSRVRRYYLPPLDISKQKEILKSFFLDDPSIDTFEKFFLSSGGFKEKEYNDYLDRIIISLHRGKRELPLNGIWEFCEMFDKSDQSDYILKKLVDKIEEAFLQGFFTASQAREMIKIINEDTINSKVFNISKKNLFENLYRKLLEVSK